MKSKTPKFDALIEPILEGLEPHTRECKWKGEHQHCEGGFEIKEGDIKFFKLFRVPPPNYCPTCRRMRRMVHMGTLRLFKVACDAPEHGEEMISIFPPECPFPIYDYKYFMSEEFNPLSFGVEYKEGEDPMEVLLGMRKKFPMPSFLNRDPGSINSEYSNGGRDTKNVYYASGCFSSENVWYSNLLNRSKNIMDSKDIVKSEYLYEGFRSDHIYKSAYIYLSGDCTESMFLFDCRNCRDCFGCVGQRNAKYMVWNEQLSEEEYKEFIRSVYPLTREKLEEYEDKFWKLVKSTPINASCNVSTENCDAIMLRDSKDVFDMTRGIRAENLRYCDGGLTLKDSMDVLFSGASSLLYSDTNIGSKASNVKFSVSSKFCVDSEFIFNSKNLDNCFMCFGLENKSYCVLNKQYSKEEYWPLVDKIKTKMLERGEYGDAVGFEFSALAYNFSHGQISFPLSAEEVSKLGGYTAPEPEIGVSNIKVLNKDEFPKTIDETTDDILEVAIKCEETGRPFRIIASELGFYQEMRLPLPSVHPSVRLDRKHIFAPIGISYDTKCKKCERNIKSAFDPHEGYTLYCEDCYKKEVY